MEALRALAYPPWFEIAKSPSSIIRHGWRGTGLPAKSTQSHRRRMDTCGSDRQEDFFSSIVSNSSCTNRRQMPTGDFSYIAKDNLYAFLESRYDNWLTTHMNLEGHEKLFEGQPTPDPIRSSRDPDHAPVTVRCGAAGLRILSSPAYFVDWTYFGAPTSPVSGYLLPGRYIFGMDNGSADAPIADNAVFRIPGQSDVWLESFWGPPASS
jgi:hypothetical protein